MAPDERDAGTEVARVVTGIAAGRLMRSVNFHATPASRADALDAQFASLARSFVSVTPARLDAALDGGWHDPRPPVVLAFYNGYRDNFDVARPLLERHGLVGWFFVATEWLGVDPAEQHAYGSAHGMRPPAAPADDPRVALSWEEVVRLAERHVIASHTRTHARVDASDVSRLRHEIVGSQEDLVERLGRPVEAFAWLLGSRFGDHAAADELVREAGYRYLVSNFAIQRLRRPDGRP